jgi:hypothetical protein
VVVVVVSDVDVVVVSAGAALAGSGALVVSVEPDVVVVVAVSVAPEVVGDDVSAAPEVVVVAVSVATDVPPDDVSVVPDVVVVAVSVAPEVVLVAVSVAPDVVVVAVSVAPDVVVVVAGSSANALGERMAHAAASATRTVTIRARSERAFSGCWWSSRDNSRYSLRWRERSAGPRLRKRPVRIRVGYPDRGRGAVKTLPWRCKVLAYCGLFRVYVSAFCSLNLVDASSPRDPRRGTTQTRRRT